MPRTDPLKISRNADAALAQHLKRAADFIAIDYPAQTYTGYSTEGYLRIAEFKLDQMRYFLAYLSGSLSDAPQAAAEILTFLQRVQDSAQRAPTAELPPAAP